jgi:hypothetical protein
LLRLTLLAPDIVQAALDGRQTDGVTLPRLLEPFPVEWSTQPRRLSVAEPQPAAALTDHEERNADLRGSFHNYLRLNICRQG